MGEDILSVIFLALICIVISSIIYRMVPGQLMMPTFALMAVCLWVAYDYMLLQRYQEKKQCSMKLAADDLDKKIDNLMTELNDTAEPVVPAEPEEQVQERPEPKHKNEFDIQMYDKNLSTQELYKDSGCAGDNQIANRMKYMGLQSRMSQDIRTRWNAEKFRPYFEEELDEQERRDWWDTEAEYLDVLM